MGPIIPFIGRVQGGIAGERGRFVGGAGILVDLSYRICYNKGEWGYDELVKRIPCRVVRSVPFKRSDDASQSGRRGTERSVDGSFGTAQPGFEPPINSSGYTFRANAVRSPFGESAAGLLLDCLA